MASRKKNDRIALRVMLISAVLFIIGLLSATYAENVYWSMDHSAYCSFTYMGTGCKAFHAHSTLITGSYVVGNIFYYCSVIVWAIAFDAYILNYRNTSNAWVL